MGLAISAAADVVLGKFGQGHAFGARHTRIGAYPHNPGIYTQRKNNITKLSILRCSFPSTEHF